MNADSPWFDDAVASELIETVPGAAFLVEREKSDLESDEDEWRLLAANAFCITRTGIGPYVGAPFSSWCDADQTKALRSNYAQALDGWEQITYVEFLDVPNGQQWWLTHLIPLRASDGRGRIIGSAKDITNAHQAVRALGRFIPICAACKSVRCKGDADDLERPENWISIEEYLSTKTTTLTHSYCPSCAATVFDRA